MGEESVILCRDRTGRIHVFLNSCRHRGMKVCRYDEGNTLELMCPYHGWTYATDGALVGVPFGKDAYGEQLDKSKWGLIEVARMENYKGTIWAAWDAAAPSFLDYVGGYKLYLDLLLDAWDGREGGTEAIGGIHKWLIPCNWKFPAENFSGDRYHGVSHRSVDMVGIGPSGKGRRDTQERNEARWLDVSFPELGHSIIASLRQRDAPTAPAYADKASRGTTGRQRPYHCEMGLGRATRAFEDHGLRLPGAITDVTVANASGYNQRGFYRRWRQFMEATSWKELAGP